MYVYICICTHMFVYMYVYIYIYTYTYYVQSALLTNCSRAPVITERVQSNSEMTHVMMMMVSNVTDTYMFLAAKRGREEFQSFPPPADSTSVFCVCCPAPRTHLHPLLSSLCTRWCQRHRPGQSLSCRCGRCCWRRSLNQTVWVVRDEVSVLTAEYSPSNLWGPHITVCTHSLH